MTIATNPYFDDIRERQREIQGYSHARSRLLERYGISLRCRTIDKLSRAIAESERRCVVLRFLFHAPLGRLLIAVPVERQWVAFVWDIENQRIVTALPGCRLDPWRSALEQIENDETSL